MQEPTTWVSIDIGFAVGQAYDAAWAGAGMGIGVSCGVSSCVTYLAVGVLATVNLPTINPVPWSGGFDTHTRTQKECFFSCCLPVCPSFHKVQNLPLLLFDMLFAVSCQTCMQHISWHFSFSFTANFQP